MWSYLDALTVQPLIKIWTTLLLRRCPMGKTASYARINRASHLLVFPCSCVFKFEPVREPDACICLLQRKSWVPSRPEDRLTKPDWPYSMSRAFGCVFVPPPNLKKKKKAVMIEGRSRIGNAPAGAKARGWITHWSERERKVERYGRRNSFDCPQSIIRTLPLSIICNLSLFDSL